MNRFVSQATMLGNNDKLVVGIKDAMMTGVKVQEGLDSLRRDFLNKFSDLHAEINQVKVRDSVAITQMVRDEMYEQLK